MRSMTLIPVSKVSIVGERSRNAGGSRWIDQRSVSAAMRLELVDRLADHVPEPAERRRADRNGDRAARVDADDAARQAVGRVHGDRAHAIVAEVLLHLCDEDARRVACGDLDLERRVDLGEPVGEDGVDDDALDLDDPARVRAGCLGHVSPEAKG